VHMLKPFRRFQQKQEYQLEAFTVLLTKIWTCITMCLHIGHWWSKIPCQTQCDSFGELPIFHGHVTTWLFPASMTKKCCKMTICECNGSRWAVTEVSKNWFQKLDEHWQKCVTAQGNYFQRVLCK
jgi:hypothetical protein